jgi:heat shock protein HslJ
MKYYTPLLFLIVICSCKKKSSPTSIADSSQDSVATLIVSDYKVAVTTGDTTKSILWRHAGDTSNKWSVLNGEIDNFKYEEGAEYKIKVKTNLSSNDSSKRKFTLLETISKTTVKFDSSLMRTFKLIASVDTSLKGYIQKFQPELSYKPDEGKFFGRGGCNDVFGTIKVTGHAIHFKDIGNTQKSCPESKLEMKLLLQLKSVTGYEISGSHLSLLKGNERILEFENVVLMSR